MKAAGFVLTGGCSTRMGRDKALLPWRGRTLAEELATTVRAVTGSATLIGEPPRYTHLELPCLADFRPGNGPLAGLETMLSHSAAELNLVLACDSPGLPIHVLQQLLIHADRSPANCVVTRDREGRVHPLCGVYRPACLPAIRHALDAGQLRLQSVLEVLQPEFFSLETPLANLNTPADWMNWQNTQ